MHHNATCCLLLFLNHKRRICKTKVVHGLGEHHGEDFFFVVGGSLESLFHDCRCGLLAPVHEEVFGPGVPVNVHEDVNISAFQGFTDHFFHACNLRAGFDRRGDPLPVQVEARETAAVVADYYPVRVQHWYYFEDVRITEISGLLLISQNKLNDTFHDEATVAFARVYPSANYHTLAVRNRILCRGKIRDD